MRREYKKAVFDLWRENSKLIWGGDVLIKEGKGSVICDIWRNSKSSKKPFIRISSNVKDEAFGVEIGWNVERSVPRANIFDQRYFDYYGEALNFDSNIVGLQLLVTGNELGWRFFELEDLIEDPEILIKTLTEKEIEKDIKPVFKKAFSMLVEHGLPYLEKAVRKNNE